MEALEGLAVLAFFGVILLVFPLFFLGAIVLALLAHSQRTRILQLLSRVGQTFAMVSTRNGVAGQVHGVPIELYLSSNAALNHFRGVTILATIPDGLPKGLVVDGSGCHLIYPFGPTAHATDDSEFDRAITTRGESRPEVLRVVSAPRIKAALTLLEQSFAGKFQLLETCPGQGGAFTGRLSPGADQFSWKPPAGIVAYLGYQEMTPEELTIRVREVADAARVISEHLASAQHLLSAG